nr:Mur ligase family protein [Neisseria weixii]
MKTLQDWLSYLETAHSTGLIDMGLERVGEVKNRMGLTPQCPVVVAAGTNGKGSVCAYLSQIYKQAGFKVGTLTSPHILRFNERIAVNAEPVGDATIVEAFERIEAARGDVSLTYFEFNTLAAVDIFIRAEVDVMVLEVGLGGRLDAVNVFDADCAVVTSVDLDHQAFLGIRSSRWVLKKRVCSAVANRRFAVRIRRRNRCANTLKKSARICCWLKKILISTPWKMYNGIISSIRKFQTASYPNAAMLCRSQLCAVRTKPAMPPWR